MEHDELLTLVLDMYPLIPEPWRLRDENGKLIEVYCFSCKGHKYRHRKNCAYESVNKRLLKLGVQMGLLRVL